MQIPPNKVNLAEQDIENYLYENPASLRFDGREVETWFGRQVTVPSGIIDLLGALDDGSPAVVEVKNVPIDAEALAQVSRYAYDVDRILRDTPCYAVERVVVGPSASTQVFREAEALGIHILTFTTHFTAQFSSLSWTREFVEQRNEAWDRLRNTGGALLQLAGYVMAARQELGPASLDTPPEQGGN